MYQVTSLVHSPASVGASSSPTRALSSVDLPALTLPAIASRSGPESRAPASASWSRDAGSSARSRATLTSSRTAAVSGSSADEPRSLARSAVAHALRSSRPRAEPARSRPARRSASSAARRSRSCGPRVRGALGRRQRPLRRGVQDARPGLELVAQLPAGAAQRVEAVLARSRSWPRRGSAGRRSSPAGGGSVELALPLVADQLAADEAHPDRDDAAPPRPAGAGRRRRSPRSPRAVAGMSAAAAGEQHADQLLAVRARRAGPGRTSSPRRTSTGAVSPSSSGSSDSSANVSATSARELRGPLVEQLVVLVRGAHHLALQPHLDVRPGVLGVALLDDGLDVAHDRPQPAGQVVLDVGDQSGRCRRTGTAASRCRARRACACARTGAAAPRRPRSDASGFASTCCSAATSRRSCSWRRSRGRASAARDRRVGGGLQHRGAQPVEQRREARLLVQRGVQRQARSRRNDDTAITGRSRPAFARCRRSSSTMRRHCRVQVGLGHHADRGRAALQGLAEEVDLRRGQLLRGVGHEEHAVGGAQRAEGDDRRAPTPARRRRGCRRGPARS